MKNKARMIIVHSCKECPYVKNTGNWTWPIWCEYMTRKEGRNIVKIIDDPDTIPSWCPLKKLEEK